MKLVVGNTTPTYHSKIVFPLIVQLPWEAHLNHTAGMFGC